MAHRTDIPHLGWSSHVYPLDAADFAQVPDYAGPAIPSAALPDDALAEYLEKNGYDEARRAAMAAEDRTAM